MVLITNIFLFKVSIYLSIYLSIYIIYIYIYIIYSLVTWYDRGNSFPNYNQKLIYVCVYVYIIYIYNLYIYIYIYIYIYMYIDRYTDWWWWKIVFWYHDQWKAFSFISSQDHFQRSSSSWISDTLRAGFEHAQSLSSNVFEWSCAVVITTTLQR